MTGPVGVVGGEAVSAECRSEAGFSLVELAIVMVVISIVLTMGIAAYPSLSQSQQLKGAAEAVGRQVQLSRARAMATGATQTLTFDKGTTPHSVLAQDAGGSRRWKLPRGISFATGSPATVTLTRDGRASSSQYIVVQNLRGSLDTVSVQISGLVIVR
jgi:prepilin-type N-terminal cleavage/methylation domain-containing protein